MQNDTDTLLPLGALHTKRTMQNDTDTLPPLGVSHTKRTTQAMRKLFASMLPELHAARMNGASFADLATRFVYGNGATPTPGEVEVWYIEALYKKNEECEERIIEQTESISKMLQALNLPGSVLSVQTVNMLATVVAEFSGTPASRALVDHLLEVSRGNVWYCQTDIYPLALMRKYKDHNRRREIVIVSPTCGIQILCELDSAGLPIRPESQQVVGSKV